VTKLQRSERARAKRIERGLRSLAAALGFDLVKQGSELVRVKPRAKREPADDPRQLPLPYESLKHTTQRVFYPGHGFAAPVCDHCGTPEPFNVLCPACEDLVDVSTGRVVPRACNRHDDCEHADNVARESGRHAADHCGDEECDQCLQRGHVRDAVWWRLS
jgi:hypothetical protein